MKKVTTALTALAFISLPFCLQAQDVKEKKEIEERVEKIEKTEKKEKAEKKEIEEIIIRNKGSKDLNLKVEVNGETITVNGKPLAEFKNDQVTINKRKMIIRDGDREMTFNFSPDAMGFGENFMKEWNNGKEVSRPFLGVTTEKVSGGAKIVEVVKESAAEKAGLKKDDIITYIGEVKITDGETLSEIISAKKPKELLKVSYLRNGKQGSVKATLGERKMKAPAAFTYRSPKGSVRSFTAPRIGGVPNADLNMALGDRLYDLEEYGQQLNDAFPRQKRLGLKIQDTEEGGNVKIIDVEEGSAAEKAGLKKDDIITEIGGKKIGNTDDAREQLFPSEAKTAYTIKAKRNGTEMNFEVKFPKKLKTANL